MQTFLPYPDFRESVRTLDGSRLGNQVYREALTLLRGGWPNHPASRMWKNFTPALALYALAGFDELKERGFDYWQTRTIVEQYVVPPVKMPPWLGDQYFHDSHKSNLLRKDGQWYGQFGWTQDPSAPYLWPVLTDEGYLLRIGNSKMYLDPANNHSQSEKDPKLVRPLKKQACPMLGRRI